MNRLCIAGVVVFFTPIAILAAAADPALSVGSGVGNCYSGHASTYNPVCETDPREKVWGNKTSSGIPYNANDYSAAIQISLGRKERCGVGNTCYVAVQEPKGRTVILKITDNGGLNYPSSGRIIDLNEKSMRYLSYGLKGNCSGVINNVKVCFLNGDQSAKLGPIDEADREQWARKIINAPQAQLPSNGGSSLYTSGSPYGSLLYSPQQPYLQTAQYPSQSGGTQPGQYFTSGYTSVPANQAFPYASPVQSNTNANTNASGNSVASSLLDLIRPVTFTPAPTQIPLASATSGSVVTIQPQRGEQGTSSSQRKIDIVQIQPPQTFAQVPARTEQTISQSDGAILSYALNALKSALLRLLDIVRMR